MTRAFILIKRKHPAAHSITCLSSLYLFTFTLTLQIGREDKQIKSICFTYSVLTVFVAFCPNPNPAGQCFFALPRTGAISLRFLTSWCFVSPGEMKTTVSRVYSSSFSRLKGLKAYSSLNYTNLNRGTNSLKMPSLLHNQNVFL